jgi:hypothetical protein
MCEEVCMRGGWRGSATALRGKAPTAYRARFLIQIGDPINPNASRI